MRQLTDTTWVLEGPTNIGFIEKNNEVILIDSGNDKESGRKINKILKEKGWMLKTIINTHSNADHIGGNDYLQRNLNCEIYSSIIENVFIEYPYLETAFLWGGLEVKDIRNKFFQAKPSNVTKIIKNDEKINEDLESVSLKGHYFNMIGIKTADDVFFIADSLFGKEILEKYKIPFIYDVRRYKQTIDKIRKIKTEYFVPSHGDIEKDIEKTALLNQNIVKEIEEIIIEILDVEMSYEQLLKEICEYFKIELNIGQYALVGSTIKSFLTYLYDEKRIVCEIKNNILNWNRKTV